MWLINVHTFQLEHFVGPDSSVGGYAILSHTWGTDEVTFQDMQDVEAARSKAGWQKIQMTCARTKTHYPDLAYAWIDTCCIDKTSSAELQEAINSMYTWYQKSAVCYAYLVDVEHDHNWNITGTTQVVGSRWFTRGWTLQELIAPEKGLEFLDRNWQYLGTRQNYSQAISARTGVPMPLLNRSSGSIRLESYSAAQKMSWAADRESTRVEDNAYCLMGLFGIFMPLLYGEGTRSFTRLQEEILRISPDLSILLWDFDDKWTQSYGGNNESLFAPSPRCFAKCYNIIHYANDSHAWIQESAAERIVSVIGLKTRLPVLPMTFQDDGKADCVVLLSCFDRIQPMLTIALKLTNQRREQWNELPYANSIGEGTLRLLPYSHQERGSGTRPSRRRTKYLDVIEAERLTKTSLQNVILLRRKVEETPGANLDNDLPLTDTFDYIWLRFSSAEIGRKWNCTSMYPASWWNRANWSFTIDRMDDQVLLGALLDDNAFSSGDNPRFFNITGAVTLERQGMTGNAVLVSFACPIMEMRKFPRKLFFRVDIIRAEDELPDCRQLMKDVVPSSSDELMMDESWADAKGVSLPGNAAGTVFAVKPEIRDIGGRSVAILHAFWLASMQSVRRLDEDTHLPVNERGDTTMPAFENPRAAPTPSRPPKRSKGYNYIPPPMPGPNNIDWRAMQQRQQAAKQQPHFRRSPTAPVVQQQQFGPFTVQTPQFGGLNAMPMAQQPQFGGSDVVQQMQTPQFHMDDLNEMSENA